MWEAGTWRVSSREEVRGKGKRGVGDQQRNCEKHTLYKLQIKTHDSKTS